MWTSWNSRFSRFSRLHIGCTAIVTIERAQEWTGSIPILGAQKKHTYKSLGHCVSTYCVNFPTSWLLLQLVYVTRKFAHETSSEKYQQPPVGPSVDSLCHPWFTTTYLSYRFLIFETPATALCVTTGIHMYIYITYHIYIYIRGNTNKLGKRCHWWNRWPAPFQVHLGSCRTRHTNYLVFSYTVFARATIWNEYNK